LKLTIGFQQGNYDLIICHEYDFVTKADCRDSVNFQDTDNVWMTKDIWLDNHGT